ncbi:nucleotide sugar dehydrogenase [Haloferax chudinovii]|uniref:UDP-N-acetyl-D-mannosamine dehydrogenase n=1 Tax=Haloferax chudinovii TaxID=1109010 RepID=A0ABD5XFH9_9EURY
MSRERPGLYGSDRSPDEQRRALRAGEVPVAVYGLGKMGLPLAAVYARATGNVTGVDISEDVVRGVNDGECHVAKEPGLPELVAEQTERGALRATTDSVDAAEGAAIHVIIVPTPLTDDREPDLAAFEAVLDSIARGLAPGDLVVVECTVPPGTSTDLVVPYLADRSGLSAGEFGVAFCPERTSSGRALRDITESHPKIVGGVDAESTRVAALVYGEITANEVIPVGDATTAEAVKLFEGVYRDVNIALANELARLRDDLGIDVTEAIDAANTQPYCDIHAPGPGVGGHCIPWYPYFITSRVDAETPLLLTAREVNDSMPAFTADKLRDELAAAGREIRGATVAVLGVTYRPGVAETRATPAAGVIDRLNDLGATVLAVDPMLPDEVVASFGATPVSLADLPTRALDAAVVVTPHEEFDGIDWAAFDDLVVVDGRGTLGDIGHRVYEIGGGPRSGASETESELEAEVAVEADSAHGGPGR